MISRKIFLIFLAGFLFLSYCSNVNAETNNSPVPQEASQAIRHWWRRRNAIEPIIGHSKSDHRLNRNQLAGELGDQFNVIFAACGFNIKKLIRAFGLFIHNVVNNITQLNFQRTFA